MNLELTEGHPSTLELQDAADFINALKSGKTAAEAAEAVGKPLPELLRQTVVKRRVEELYAYHFEKGESRDKIVEAGLMEIFLMDPDNKNKLGAAKMLLPKDEGPLVQVNLSEELKSIKLNGPLWPEDEK